MSRPQTLVPAVLLIASFASIAAASHSSRRWETDPRGVLIAIARAPEKERARRNPYAEQRDAVLAGAKLFREHCAECHGSDGWGSRHAANLHAADVQGATPGELEWLLRNGNIARGMPSWSGLPEPRRWQIVSYLKTMH